MKISRPLTDEEIQAAETAPEYVRKATPAKPTVPDPQMGDVISYDAQPKIIQEVYPDRQRRVFTRVSRVDIDEETKARHIRLSYVRQNDWQDWDNRSVKEKLAKGEMRIEDPFELIQLIKDAIEVSRPDIAQLLEEVLAKK